MSTITNNDIDASISQWRSKRYRYLNNSIPFDNVSNPVISVIRFFELYGGDKILVDISEIKSDDPNSNCKEYKSHVQFKKNDGSLIEIYSSFTKNKPLRLVKEITYKNILIVLNKNINIREMIISELIKYEELNIINNE